MGLQYITITDLRKEIAVLKSEIKRNRREHFSKIRRLTADNNKLRADLMMQSMDENNTDLGELIKIAIESLLGINIALKSRKRLYIYTRAIFYKIMRLNTQKSLKDIGVYVGLKDHTTVIWGLGVCEDLLETKDAEFLELYERINNYVNVKVFKKEHC